MEAVTSSEVSELLSAPRDGSTTCPIARFLGVLDGAWATLVVRELLTGTKRFGDLRDGLPGISPKTLTDRLRRLEEAGLVTRRAYAEVPPRVEYTLTEGGRDLVRVLSVMAEWAERWLDDGSARPPRPRTSPNRPAD